MLSRPKKKVHSRCQFWWVLLVLWGWHILESPVCTPSRLSEDSPELLLLPGGPQIYPACEWFPRTKMVLENPICAPAHLSEDSPELRFLSDTEGYAQDITQGFLLFSLIHICVLSVILDITAKKPKRNWKSKSHSISHFTEVHPSDMKTWRLSLHFALARPNALFRPIDFSVPVCAFGP